ncbi:MAG: T9SS type A sorting domain-containing protein [Saprospiraceae bacterium]
MKRIRYLLFSALMSLVSLTAIAQSTITITTTAGTCCATEKWVSITTAVDGGGTQVWGQGDGTYGNAQGLLANESVSLAPGTYYVNCYDRYDDGWDGGLIDVVAYGTTIGNNGGVSPNDGNDVDGGGSWETPADELEASFMIVVPTAPSCVPPSAGLASSVTSSSASLGWTENGTATAWDVEWGATGFTQGTGTVDTASFNPKMLSGLTANTSYDYYVRADCGGSTSTWAGPYSFYTGHCQVSSSNSSSYFDDFTTTGGSTNISNTGSGYATNGYQDATTMTVSQYATGSITFSTTLVGTTVGVNVWVDWNNDLDFDDTGEKVYASGAYVGSASGSITVPVGTPIGSYRMRAICDYNSTNPGACSPNARSETEDYTFAVVAAPACVPPSAGVASNLTATSADLGWTDNNMPSNTAWDVEWGSTGFTQGTGTTVAVSANPYTLNGLAANTTYDFYVRADCAIGGGGSGQSAWVGPYSFTTACASVTLPWIESFETMASTGTGVVPDCMVEVGDWVTTGTVQNRNRAPRTGTNFIHTNWTADDWLYTPSMDLTAGTSYDFSFYYVTDGLSGWTTLETAMGNGQTSAAMTTTIGTAVSGATNTTYTKYTATFTPATTGTYNLGIHVVANGSPWYITFDDLQVETTPTCISPNALTATNLTPSSADLGWTNNNTAADTSSQIEYGPDGFMPGMGTGTIVYTGANPYTLNSLTENTVYDFYVRTICSPGDTSAWSGEGTFTTPLACPTPTALTTANVTATGADLGWTDNAGATSWLLEYGPNGFTPGTGVGTATSVVTGTNPHSVSSLMSNTNYDFYVRAICGAGDTSIVWSSAGSFTTLCDVFTLPQLEDFSAGFTPDACWDEATSGTPATGPSGFGSGNWRTDGFGNNGSTGAAKINLYAANVEDWILTPQYSLTGAATYVVEFDFGVFAFAGTGVTTLGSDDQIQVLVSTNGGTSWTSLATYDNTYVTAVGGNQESIDVTAYANKNAQFAIWATDGSVNDLEDNDIFIDNFRVRGVFPNDVGVTAVTVASSVVCNTSDSVTIDITNFGTATQTTFPVSYTVNGGTAVTETWTGSLATGVTVQHTFATPYDASMAGAYEVKVYTELSVDGVKANDSTTVTRTTALTYTTPFGENFEAITNPNWISNGNITGAHNAPSNVLFYNLYGSAPGPFTTTTPKIGAIATGDIFKFDYRYANYTGGGTVGKDLTGENDRIYIYVSTDCGANFTVIDSIYEGNHVTSAAMATKMFDLSAYAGQTIQIATQAVYASGDYYVDLDNFFIGAPLAITMSVATDYNGSDISCNGGANGAGLASATGGLMPYTYAWDANAGSQMNDTATALMAGKYLVTVTDAIGNMAVDSITLTEPTIVTSSISASTNLSCNAGNDGAATAMGAGGTGMYTYAWDAAADNQMTATASNLTAGKYLVTITDMNGCFSKDTVIITEPTAVVASISASTNVTCNGASTGTATAMGAGGAGSYTYAWDAAAANQTTAMASNLAAGTYSVTVSDANSCSSIAASVTITEPTAVVASISAQTNVACNGASTGRATARGTGGTGVHAYAWSSGQTDSVASNLAAGTYTVTVTDANGCTANTSVTITEPTAVIASISASTNVSCNGLSDGRATARGAGGTGGHTYAWSSGQTDSVASNLAAGTYTVTVTDASGCTANTSVIITEPAVLIASISGQTNIDCNGNTTGSATVMGTGGTMNYSYAWDAAAGNQTTAMASNLGAGTYNVTITDANNCTANTSVTITEPMALTASAAVTSNYNGTDVSCNAATNGKATVTAMGGTMPYTYVWSNGQTDTTASNLGAGTYTVTVTDANGCTMSASVTVNEPMLLTATAVETSQASCSGGADGAAKVVGMGGTAPYTYAWDAGANNQTDTVANSLTAGNYNVTVTDANGCTAITTVTITSPSGLGASTIVFNNVSCAGAADGTVNLTVVGGTAPYSYSWSNGMTSEDLFGVAGGNYTVTITDINGCTVNASAMVTEPTGITSSATTTDVDCNGNTNGAVDLTVSGGSMPYTYIWNNGAITEDLSNVAAGTYSVTIRDNNGCSKVETVTVNEPTVLMASGTATDVDCNGNTTGSVDLTVSGGTAPYTYAWDNMMTTEDLSGLSAGTYNVTVTDANSCSTVASVTVAEPAALSLSKSVTNPDCNGDADGTIDLTVMGGTGPYTFAWDNMMTTEDLSGLSAGTYNVTVTDANSCSMTTSGTVIEPAMLAASVTITDVACNGGATGSVDLAVTGGTGPYTFAWDNMMTTEDLSSLSAGTYNVTVTDANSCSTSAMATVSEPTMALSASVTATDAVCNAGNGSIDLTVMGGTGPYTFAWDDVSSTTIEDLSAIAGTYNVVITDANGCTANASATIAEPTAISGVAATTDVTCNGAANGAIDLTVTGGTGSYTFAWSNMATTEDLSGLSGGSYTVTITDANNCIAVGSYTITESAVLASTGTFTNVNCTGGNDGTVTVAVTGGTAPFTYAWDSTSIGNTGNATGLLAGVYGVTITDANSCSTTSSFTVTEPASSLALSSVTTPASCFGGNDGTVNLTVTGGTGAGTYGYVWSNLVTTQNLVNLVAGSYSVTVTDGNGCTATTTVTVTQPLGFGTSLSATNVSCNGGSDGAVDLNISGGTAPYTFAWNNMATTEDLANVPAGNYTVTVTDANGCTIVLSQMVSEPTMLAITGTVTDASCNSANGGNDGTISVMTTGGTGTYTYAWSNGIGNASTITGLVGGAYTVTATDVNGCSMSATYNVNEPTLLLAVANVVQAIQCAGDTASISGIVGGGTAPYAFTWADASGNAVTDLANITIGGTYTGTITDANGCVATTSAFIAEPAPITVDNILVDDVLCAGENSGSINLTATGGTGVLNYSWNVGAIGNNNNANGLGAGNYSVTITDANNCSTSDVATINEPTAIVLSTTAAADTTNSMIGSATVTATGGVGGYTYNWNVAGGATTSEVTGLVAGTYTVTVTDANGCSETATVIIENFEFPVNTRELDYIADLGVFPNPTRGNVTITLELSRYADVSVKIYNLTGQVVEDLGLHNTTNETFQLDLSNYASGMYYVRFIIDGDVITRKLMLNK